MRFIKNIQAEDHLDDDPMTGVAQLFDVSVAFIVAMIAAVFTLLSSADLLNKNSDWTLVRKNKNGEMEMLEKKNGQLISRKVSNAAATGNGVRLGTAYQLEDGQVIYVPDKK